MSRLTNSAETPVSQLKNLHLIDRRVEPDLPVRQNAEEHLRLLGSHRDPTLVAEGGAWTPGLTRAIRRDFPSAPTTVAVLIVDGGILIHAGTNRTTRSLKVDKKREGGGTDPGGKISSRLPSQRTGVVGGELEVLELS